MRFGFTKNLVFPEPEPPITSMFLFLAYFGCFGLPDIISLSVCRLQFRDAGHHRCVCQWGCGADYLDFGSHPGLELPKTSIRGSRTVCAARCTGLHGSCGFFYGRQPDHSKHLEILVPDAWRSNFPIGHERLVPAPVHKHGGVLPCEPAFVVRRSYP